MKCIVMTCDFQYFAGKADGVVSLPLWDSDRANAHVFDTLEAAESQCYDGCVVQQISCEKCGSPMIQLYGVQWDTDKGMCSDIDCRHKVEYDYYTYEENGEWMINILPKEDEK